MQPTALVLGIILIVFLGAIPGEIAKRRGHKNAGAIKACGWIGVFVWPAWIVGLVWSLTDPGPVDRRRRAKRTSYKG